MKLISHNAGVFIMLGSNSIRNNSNIRIGEIGEGDDGALICVTALIWWCRNADTPGMGGAGEWFYPNGSAVPIEGSGYDFYRSRGTGIVRLNRRNNAMSTIGGTFTNSNTCINIGEKII